MNTGRDTADVVLSFEIFTVMHKLVLLHCFWVLGECSFTLVVVHTYARDLFRSNKLCF
jgi:hypothetical protein